MTTPSWIRFTPTVTLGSGPVPALSQKAISPSPVEQTPGDPPALVEPDPLPEKPLPAVKKKRVRKPADPPPEKKGKQKSGKAKEGVPLVGELIADPHQTIAISVRYSRIVAWKEEVARRGTNLSAFVRDFVEAGIARGD